MAGIDSSKISPSNPFEKSGSTAVMLQAAIAELDPAQAARWRVAAGGSLSVATMAELQSGEELSTAAQADLWNHDPEFVAEFQQQREKSLEAQLKALEGQCCPLIFRSLGIPTRADRLLKRPRLIGAGSVVTGARPALHASC